jgi:hypothetical protein
VGPDGAILVTDLVQANAKLYDSTGHLVRVVGRPGNGPGEFRFPRFPQFARDGRIVVAEGRGIVHRFSKIGQDPHTFHPTGLTFYLSFRVLDDGDLLILGGTGDKFSLTRYDSIGTRPRTLFERQGVPVADQPTSPRWKGINAFYFAEVADTAFVVASLSDTLWKVNINTGAVTTALMRFDGFDRPALPAAFPVDNSYSWTNAFYIAWRPAAGNNVVVIPFARGFLDDTNGRVGFVRSTQGEWLAIEDAPILVAAANGELIGREEGEDGSIRINFYRAAPRPEAQ